MDVISEYECVKNATKNKNSKLNILGLPEVINIEAKDINNDDLKSPLKILKLLPISPEFDHQYTFMVARFCYFYDLKFKVFGSGKSQKMHLMKIIKNGIIHGIIN